MIRFAFGAVLRAGDALEGGRIERREQRFGQAGVRVDKGRLYGGACVESAGQRGRKSEIANERDRKCIRSPYYVQSV